MESGDLRVVLELSSIKSDLQKDQIAKWRLGLKIKMSQDFLQKGPFLHI